MRAFINSKIACCPIIDRLLHQLKEDNSELINKLWTDIQQKIAAQSQTPSGTPSPAPPSGEQKGLFLHCLILQEIVTCFILLFLKYSNF